MVRGFEASLPAAARKRRWLRTVRISLVLSAILLPALYLSVLPPRHNKWFPYLAQGLGIVLVLQEGLYASILWWLRAKTLRKGLALAVATGSATSVLAIAFLLLFTVSGYLEWVATACLGLLTLAQAQLLIGAIATYYTLGREPGDGRRLFSAFAMVALYFVFLLFVVVPGTIPMFVDVNYEARATAVLGKLNTAEEEYASRYNSGFTDSLNRLGPPVSGPIDRNHADLVDPVLAGRTAGGANNGFEKDEYRFTYIPGEAHPKEGITTYSITARPLHYGQTAVWSFFTDESRVIRSTSENRPATVQDPPI